tara:strand:- start:1679 stop:2035 length:357 start_codon:yes stop_codon:yes gene_type:complete
MFFNSVKQGSFVNTNTISGRTYVLGLKVMPVYTPAESGSGTKVEGTIVLKNGSASGDTLIEVPVTMATYYPADIGFNYVEHDGYVLFPDGVYVTETFADAAKKPLDTSLTSFTIIYQV